MTPDKRQVLSFAVWPFSDRKVEPVAPQAPATAEQDWRREIALLQADVAALGRVVAEERAARDRQVKALQIEWDEWFDKYRRLYARLAQRAKSEVQSSEDTPPSDDRRATAPPPLQTHVVPATAHLSRRFKVGG